MKIIYLSLFISLSPYDFNNTPHEFLHRPEGAMSICMPSKRAYKTSQYINNNNNINNNMFVSICIFVECLYCLYFYL